MFNTTLKTIVGIHNDNTPALNNIKDTNKLKNVTVTRAFDELTGQCSFKILSKMYNSKQKFILFIIIFVR